MSINCLFRPSYEAQDQIVSDWLDLKQIIFHVEDRLNHLSLLALLSNKYALH